MGEEQNVIPFDSSPGADPTGNAPPSLYRLLPLPHPLHEIFLTAYSTSSRMFCLTA
jgi:hypothetical protein